MKKITHATITLLMVLILSIGSITRADDPQGGGDTPKKPCNPLIRYCPPVTTNGANTNSAINAVPQVGTVAPGGQMTYSIFFDLLLLSIQLRLGL